MIVTPRRSTPVEAGASTEKANAGNRQRGGGGGGGGGKKTPRTMGQQSQQQQQQQSRSAKPQSFIPKTAELLSAIESLYQDRVKPFGRILRKRLAEQAAAAGDQGHAQRYLSSEQLRVVCQSCAILHVNMEDGGDWSVVYTGREADFVDAQSPCDMYPEELWRAAATYFASPEGEDLVLPGSRYDCAKALAVKDLPFLVGRPLGEVCHIVQLCISQKKLLGHKKGALVPYEQSQSKAKEVCAGEKQAFDANDDDIASWDSLVEGLRVLFSVRQAAIPLCTLKRLFEECTQQQLSETALGYSKLSELLQDERLRHVCQLKLGQNGYLVIPVHNMAADDNDIEEWMDTFGMDEVDEEDADSWLQQQLSPEVQEILQGTETGKLMAEEALSSRTPRKARAQPWTQTEENWQDPTQSAPPMSLIEDWPATPLTPGMYPPRFDEAIKALQSGQPLYTLTEATTDPIYEVSTRRVQQQRRNSGSQETFGNHSQPCAQWPRADPMGPVHLAPPRRNSFTKAPGLKEPAPASGQPASSWNSKPAPRLNAPPKKFGKAAAAQSEKQNEYGQRCASMGDGSQSACLLGANSDGSLLGALPSGSGAGEFATAAASVDQLAFSSRSMWPQEAPPGGRRRISDASMGSMGSRWADIMSPLMSPAVCWPPTPRTPACVWQQGTQPMPSGLASQGQAPHQQQPMQLQSSFAHEVEPRSPPFKQCSGPGQVQQATQLQLLQQQQQQPPSQQPPPVFGPLGLAPPLGSDWGTSSPSFAQGNILPHSGVPPVPVGMAASCQSARAAGLGYSSSQDGSISPTPSGGNGGASASAGCHSARGGISSTLSSPRAPLSARGGRRKGLKPSSVNVPSGPPSHNFEADIAELVAAVESLYTDKLPAFGRILRKRLTERAAALGSTPRLNMRSEALRAMCNKCQVMKVTQREGGDWLVSLTWRSSTAVDVQSPVDMYSPDLWVEVQNYFESLTGEEAMLPGSRYDCAKALEGRQLPFFEDYSLGELNHIVQLCISQKKILGYRSGSIVPYAQSQSMQKERLAQAGSRWAAASEEGRSELPLVTWETLRERLQEVLAEDESNGVPCAVPLAKMKRLFQTRFGQELSETALGYAKVSEVLHDQRVADICRVELRTNGYVAIRVQDNSLRKRQHPPTTKPLPQHQQWQHQQQQQPPQQMQPQMQHHPAVPPLHLCPEAPNPSVVPNNPAAIAAAAAAAAAWPQMINPGAWMNSKPQRNFGPCEGQPQGGYPYNMVHGQKMASEAAPFPGARSMPGLF